MTWWSNLAWFSSRSVSGHMGDTRRQRDHSPRPAVQHAEAKWPEVHVPQAVVDRFDAEHLADEGFSDEHLIAAPLDGSVATYAARLEAIRVLSTFPTSKLRWS